MKKTLLLKEKSRPSAFPRKNVRLFFFYLEDQYKCTFRRRLEVKKNTKHLLSSIVVASIVRSVELVVKLY